MPVVGVFSGGLCVLGKGLPSQMGKFNYIQTMHVYLHTNMHVNSLQQPETTAENSPSKGRVMEPSPNCCFYSRVLLPKRQESLHKRGRKDRKSQRNREFAVRSRLLDMSESIFLSK